MEAERMDPEHMDAEPTDTRALLGAAGEDAALDVYLRAGFRLVVRNWSCALGELDLVVRRGRLLVFCEVKTRSGSAFGAGYESVTWSKRRKLRQLAEAFLTQTSVRPATVRFDVASVFCSGVHPAEVELFQDAF